MATNFDSVETFHMTSRASKLGCRNIQIPNIFINYNANMCGVDLMNHFVIDYRKYIWGRKWYWFLFNNVNSLMRVAAWRLSAYRRRKSGGENPKLTQ
jgi:hypothetical protein